MKYNSVDSRKLTNQQHIIVELVAAGLKNEDIAKQIRTTRGSVANIVRLIYDKTGLSNRVELALWWQAQHPTQAPRMSSWYFDVCWAEATEL